MAKYCDIPYKVQMDIEDKIKKEILNLLKENGVSLTGARILFDKIIEEISDTSLKDFI